MKPDRSALNRVIFTQGAYYLITGVWPLLHMDSFERVTGPKTDKWLVKTVGVLVAAIGSSLMVAARGHRVSPEAQLLAAASAAGLSLIDLTYVAKSRIAPVYLLDALSELALLATTAKLKPLKRMGDFHEGKSVE
ncbi:MAG: hypothetical protein ACXW5W_18815 [Candidatus Binatia bacterium]